MTARLESDRWQIRLAAVKAIGALAQKDDKFAMAAVETCLNDDGCGAAHFVINVLFPAVF